VSVEVDQRHKGQACGAGAQGFCPAKACAASHPLQLTARARVGPLGLGVPTLSKFTSLLKLTKRKRRVTAMWHLRAGLGSGNPPIDESVTGCRRMEALPHPRQRSRAPDPR
jgi:hypothetical protein